MAKRKFSKKRFKEFQSALWATYEETKNLETMSKILKKDIAQSAITPAGEESGDAALRAVVRASFAYIEAMVFCLKRTALRLSTFNLGDFTQAELVILAEESYELDDKGHPKTQTKFIPLSKNLRFAFEAGARVLALHFKLNVEDARWDSFKKALVIRNRLTHPKTPEDLHISEEDYQHLKEALDWFVDNFTRFKDEHLFKIKSAIEIIKKDSQE